MANGKSIASSALWGVIAVLITVASVVYAVAVGGQNAATIADVKEIKEQVHSLDIDRNVAKTEYKDLKETMINGFQEQKEATQELKALMKSHMMRETGVTFLLGNKQHNP